MFLWSLQGSLYLWNQHDSRSFSFLCKVPSPCFTLRGNWEKLVIFMGEWPFPWVLDNVLDQNFSRLSGLSYVNLSYFSNQRFSLLASWAHLPVASALLSMVGSSLRAQIRVTLFWEVQRSGPSAFPFPEAIPVIYASQNAVPGSLRRDLGQSGFLNFLKQ